MSIATNSVITWADLTTTVLNSLKSACCNIDSFAVNIPTRLRSGQGQVAVKSHTTVLTNTAGDQSGKNMVTHTWYANPSNLISVVASSTVNSEWTAFLKAAGIDARSNKTISVEDLGLAVGLFQQFLSYHLKPVYTRRQIYDTIETNPGVFQGTKYITGTATPKKVLTPVAPGEVPTLTNEDISGRYGILRESIYHDNSNYGLFDREANPVPYRCYLS